MHQITKLCTDTSLENSRELCKNLTAAESKIWQVLRNKQTGYKFRRQFSIDPYIADFACIDKMLIIEIDGGQHAETKLHYDNKRTDFLNQKGYRILRFWNNDVMENLEGVMQVVMNALNDLLGRTPPNHPLEGEGF